MYEIFKLFYDISRSGAFDYPDKDEWIKDNIELFKKNNPELFLDDNRGS